MILLAALHADVALALLQGGGRDEGWSLNGLIQAAIVFVFFVLPALKGLLEVRKRKSGERGTSGRAGRSSRAELEKQGRDLWRELLGGPREPEARPSAAPPRPKTVSRHRPPTAARPRATMEPAQAEVLRERARQAEREALLRSAEVQQPRRAADQRLGELGTGVEPTEVGRLEPTVSALRAVDPAALDDEILQRWGAEGVAEAPRTAAGIPAWQTGGGVDWRAAVLLSELISPPLALRGPGAAWPGPPAALSR